MPIFWSYSFNLFLLDDGTFLVTLKKASTGFGFKLDPTLSGLDGELTTPLGWPPPHPFTGHTFCISSGQLHFSLLTGRGIVVRDITMDPAKSDGRIQPGDELVEVDGMKLIGLPYLKSLSVVMATSDKVTFRVRRRRGEESTSHVTSPDTPAAGMEKTVTMDTRPGSEREGMAACSIGDTVVDQGEALERGDSSASPEPHKKALVNDSNLTTPMPTQTAPSRLVPMPDEAPVLPLRNPPLDSLDETIGMRGRVCECVQVHACS